MIAVAAAPRIAVLLCGLAGVTALAVLALGPAAAADWLGYSFSALPRTGAEIASILGNNLRVLAALMIACYAAQQALNVAGSGRFCWRAIAVLCDALVIATAAIHVLLVGAGLGAYGMRMVTSLLPHGAVELAAYSLALGFYVAARRERVTSRRSAEIAGVCVLLLAVAAPLEVFVVL